MIDNYEINIKTLALIPLDDKLSKIYEQDNSFIINKSVSEIINYSCKYFGSSYNGRTEGSKNWLGVSYKLPIIIEETQEIIFFPTSSPRYNNCSWISLKNINNYVKNQKGVTVNFKNDVTLEFDLSLCSFENQIFRALRLENILKERKTS